MPDGGRSSRQARACNNPGRDTGSCPGGPPDPEYVRKDELDAERKEAARQAQPRSEAAQEAMAIEDNVSVTLRPPGPSRWGDFAEPGGSCISFGGKGDGCRQVPFPECGDCRPYGPTLRETLVEICKEDGGADCDAITDEMVEEMLNGNAICADPMCFENEEQVRELVVTDTLDARRRAWRRWTGSEPTSDVRAARSRRPSSCGDGVESRTGRGCHHAGCLCHRGFGECGRAKLLGTSDSAGDEDRVSGMEPWKRRVPYRRVLPCAMRAET